MSYLSKNAILQSYKELSHLTKDPTLQGATQKVSAIRYFVALDSFYQKHDKQCNTRNKDVKKEYADYVGMVCSVCPNLYTANFFYPLKEHNKDFGVGSNFYSAGQVKASLVNTSKTFDYPLRGDKPLFRIKNGVLYRDEQLYSNYDSYIENTTCRVALVLWLLREQNIDNEDDKFRAIQKSLHGIYSNKLVETLVGDEDTFKNELANFDLGLCNKVSTIKEEDIKGLFDIQVNIKHKSDSRKASGIMIKKEKYYSALRTKPFMLLAGISGTGKSRIVREFAFKSCPVYLQDKDGTTPGNYCMVEVKPNWHDSTELLGYWSNINKKYVFTKFVKFLVKAKMYPEVPFFVCLDEMNLAPVEQYFAEFLSVLETRRIVKGEDENGEEYEEVKSGALVDKEYFKNLGNVQGFSNLRTDREIYLKLFDISDEDEIADVPKSNANSLLTEGLTLPENVFIIGTVNMDDTTHQFSRKVIDRAMTIEMNGGALGDIFKNNADLTYTDDPLTMDDLRSRYVSAAEVLEKCPAVVSNDEISSYIQGTIENGLPQRLDAINKVLKGTPFTVSYRVMNELTIYLAVLLDKATSENKNIDFDSFLPYVDTAIDKILLMKILPRVEGDDEMFKISDAERDANGLPSQVNEGNTSREYTKLDWLREIAPKHTEGEGGEYMAVDKLDEMTERLFRQNFTRYWP